MKYNFKKNYSNHPKVLHVHFLHTYTHTASLATIKAKAMNLTNISHNNYVYSLTFAYILYAFIAEDPLAGAIDLSWIASTSIFAHVKETINTNILEHRITYCELILFALTHGNTKLIHSNACKYHISNLSNHMNWTATNDMCSYICEFILQMLKVRQCEVCVCMLNYIFIYVCAKRWFFGRPSRNDHLLLLVS